MKAAESYCRKVPSLFSKQLIGAIDSYYHHYYIIIIIDHPIMIDKQISQLTSTRTLSCNSALIWAFPFFPKAGLIS